ncbi:hypothetical protein [Desulfobacter vibrioformis]|uniref:hypothetical protein n=1 Tax=Desulfobacter vibrioformis TaxID=34031 RepID=UPI0012EC3A74|nr:hypothetical protein [Desulfobacter vibrioformis]
MPRCGLLSAYKEKTAKSDELNIADTKFFSEVDFDIEKLKTYKKAYEKLIQDKNYAYSMGNTTSYDRQMKRKEDFLQFLRDENIKYELKNNGEKIQFPAIVSPETDYKTINNMIKKNYLDAMKKLKSLDKNLHTYFSNHIRSEGGAFIYTPSEDITWHLD